MITPARWGSALVALLLVACGGSAPATVVPAPTPVGGSGAVVPPVRPAAAPVPLAVIPVQVTYVLKALVPVLDSLFPARDSLATAACQNYARLVCHQYGYQRDPLQLSATGDRFAITTNLRYRARVGVPGAGIASCGFAPEAMRRATLAMSTTLYWRNNWSIASKETQFSATLLDACRVTALQIDATSALKSVVDGQLRTFAAQVDSAMPTAADLRPLADSIWKSFLEPSPLDTLNTLWLVLDPETIRVVPLSGVGPSFRTAIVVYARPHVIAGAKPATIDRALPPLMLGTSPSGFVIPLTVELPFDELDRRATELLVAETAATSVKVQQVHVSATGDSVRIGLDVSGALTGRLTLASRMRWDATARELRLDELDWSLASRGALSRVKATLAAPLIGRAIRKATNGGRVQLGAQLDSARTTMLQLLNRTVAPGVVIGGSISNFQVESVATGDRAFLVRAKLEGQAMVWVQE
ncbi:MAG: DUF4403 family protein [Gemmatimonadaceae bacterium]|nr:DUF4403 family protein [Gemmatimonadaceae bacterium]